EVRLAEHLSGLAGRDPIARHVSPRLLPARPAGLPEVLLRLDGRPDGSAWLDPHPPGSTGAEARGHRRKGPAWLGPPHRRSLAAAHGQRPGGGESPELGAGGD